MNSLPISKNITKVCVLLPDYSTTSVDYQHYDPARNLSDLLPLATVDHVFLNKLTTYKQLKKLSTCGYDIFINLCEGYLEWEVPSIEVIYFLEQLNLPFTGPSSLLYDPSKELMKYVAYTQGVKTPNFALIEKIEEVEKNCNHLQFPLFVKPGKAGDSLGVDEKSLVFSYSDLKQKITSIIDDYAPVLVEEYIDGREFTVLVVADHTSKSGVIAFNPIEYIFPAGSSFKTYALKTSELHLDANVLVGDIALSNQLKNLAVSIFKGFNGVGYARMDFRMNDKQELFFLECNFTCSVFYNNGYEGSADHILKVNHIGQPDFLSMIIEEGIVRYNSKQKKYIRKGNAISGYGIYATKDLTEGECVFVGEELNQRIVTLSHVKKSWSAEERKVFRQYAYPISEEVFILWDENPNNWAPQNHSCKANTVYVGLNVVAKKNIKYGEELTLDYAHFLDEQMETFVCSCGSEGCRGVITGTPKNSISIRVEDDLH